MENQLKALKHYCGKYCKLFTKGHGFRLVRVEGTCRKQDICDSKFKLVFARGENTTGKGESAGYWNLLLVPQCFQKTSFSGVQPFPKQAQVFMRLQYKSFENTVGKGEIASNFSFPHGVFYLFGELCHSYQNLKLSSAKSFSLEESKICHLGKG